MVVFKLKVKHSTIDAAIEISFKMSYIILFHAKLLFKRLKSFIENYENPTRVTRLKVAPNTLDPITLIFNFDYKHNKDDLYDNNESILM